LRITAQEHDEAQKPSEISQSLYHVLKITSIVEDCQIYEHYDKHMPDMLVSSLAEPIVDYLLVFPDIPSVAMKQKTAIILGGTGLTGSLLLNRLIADDSYGSIKLFSRKASGNTSPKIKEFIGDVLLLEHFKDDFTADEVFCCVGTTSSKTKDRTVYRAIDFGIPFAASKLARENNIPTFLVMSSMGANAKSKIFYSRTKGEMEQAVLDQDIPFTYILRPSLILGERNEKRFGESAGAVLLKLTNVFLIGSLKKYRAIDADCIAAAMIGLAKSLHSYPIVPSDIIQKFGSNH